MSNETSLIVGYVFVTVLFAGYWISLRVRLSKLERKIGKAN